MYGGEIVIVALIAAAVAATATTAVAQATGKGPDNANDAFGDWLKTFFISFAANSVGGAAGAAGEAGSEGMTATEMSQAQQMGHASQLVPQATNVGSGAASNATSLASSPAEGMEMAEMIAAENAVTDGGGSFGDQATLAAPNTSGMDLPGMFDQGGMFDMGKMDMNNLGIKDSVYEMLGMEKQAYGEEADAFTEMASNDVTPEENPYFKELQNFNTRNAQFGGLDPFKQQAEIQAFKAGDEWLYNSLGLELPDDEYQTSLGSFTV